MRAMLVEDGTKLSGLQRIVEADVEDDIEANGDANGEASETVVDGAPLDAGDPQE